MSKPGSLLSETEYSKVHATLEAIQEMGVIADDCERLRSQRDDMRAYQRFVSIVLTLLQDFPGWMEDEEKRVYTDISENPLMGREEAIEVLEDFVKAAKESREDDEGWLKKISLPELGAAVRVLLEENVRIHSAKPFFWGFVIAWKKIFSRDTRVERERTERRMRRIERREIAQ